MPRNRIALHRERRFVIRRTIRVSKLLSNGQVAKAESVTIKNVNPQASGPGRRSAAVEGLRRVSVYFTAFPRETLAVLSYRYVVMLSMHHPIDALGNWGTPS